MKKLFRNVSAIALTACMALSASAVALAGWNEDVYTPSVDTQTTVFNWASTYGEDGYILLGDGSGIIYSDLYQDAAYVKNADLTDHATTKGTTNKILGGMYADVYNNYRGYYYAFSQGAKALEVIKAQGGASLTDNAGRSAMNGAANAEAKADLTTNGKCDGGLLTTAPISSWGVSGSTWSNASGNTQWLTPAGDIVNVRVQSAQPAFPYTLAFVLDENAVAEGGIYVTVRTYNMKSGDMMLKNKWYANNDGAAIADDSVAAIQTASVTGDGFVTFYIDKAGAYTVVANDTANQEGITGIFFDKSEPTPLTKEDIASHALTYTTTSSDWEPYYGKNGYFIAAHDGTTKGAYIGGLVEGVEGNVITACANGQILSTSNWNGSLAGMNYTAATWTNNAATMKVAPYAPGTTNKVLGRVHSNSEPANFGAASGEQVGSVGFKVSNANLDKAEAATGERAIYVTVLDSQWNAVTAGTKFLTELYYFAGEDYKQINTIGYANYEYNRYNQTNLITSREDTLSTTEALYVTFKVEQPGWYGAITRKDAGRQVSIQALFVDYVNPADNFAGDIAVDLAGGSFAEGDSIPATYNPLTMTDDIVLPTPEKTGYDFAGWKVNGADAVLNYSITSANVGDISLVATWTATEYDIIVNLNGGAATIPATYTIESDAIVLPTPVKAGYDFAGWKVNGADAVANYTIATGTTGDISLEATWTATVYDITLTLNGGTATIPATYTIEDVIALPTPVKANYTFAGWKVNGADAVMSYTIENATGDISLEAIWTATEYAISVNLNGGEATIPATYTIESADIVLPTPVKAGYTFAGWKVNGADAVASYTIATGSTGAISLEATWTAVEYDITVNYNGGTATIVDKYTIEDVIALPTPVKANYTFAGWKVNGADAVMTYTIENATGDITLEAVWTATEYAISVNLNGGEATIVDKYTVESADIVLPTPVKANYTFAGWKVNGADAVMEYTIATGSTGAISLEATWTAVEYAISVNLNGGTATIPATYTIESADIVLPTPVKANYTFAGWKVNGADAVANYTIATGSTGAISLEATWTAVEYDITVNLNGGTATIPATYTVESDAIVLPTPVKANYTFAGWKVNGADAVANYTIATGTTGDITLEAIWTATEYAINVVLGDGSLDASVVIPATYTVESAAIVIDAVPTLEGYNFLGWKVGDAEPVASYTIPAGSTGDVTITAVYEEKPAAGCGGAIAMLSAFMGLIALAVVGKKY